MPKPQGRGTNGEDEVEKSTVPLFNVFRGNQPCYTGDEDSAKAVAQKLRSDAIHQGTDLSSKEHAITIVAI